MVVNEEYPWRWKCHLSGGYRERSADTPRTLQGVEAPTGTPQRGGDWRDIHAPLHTLTNSDAAGEAPDIPGGTHQVLGWLASAACVATASYRADVVVASPGGGRLHVVARRTGATDPHPESRHGWQPTREPTPELQASLMLDGEQLAELTVCRHLGGHRYSPGDRAVVDALLSAASDAIASDPLANQLRSVARVVERRRLARDLHDTVLQQVVGTGLALSSLPPAPHKDPSHPMGRCVERTLEDLEATAETLRSAIARLDGGAHRGERQPAGPGGTDLHRRLLTSVRAAAGGFTGELTVRMEGPVGTGVDRQAADHVVAAVGECVANAAHHAGATRIGVVVRALGGRLACRVRDNGAGWQHNPSACAPGAGSGGNNENGRGLGNLATRAAEAGGGLQVTTAPGRGSDVLWWVPHQGAGTHGNGPRGRGPGNGR